MSDTRTQIIEASIELFAESGFWNTPTSKIVQNAEISTGTLFNYFKSKNGLIDEVFLQLQQELTAAIAEGYPETGTVKERVEHIWFRYITWGVRFPVRYRLLQQLKMSDFVSSDARERSWYEWSFASTLIPEAIETGLYRDVSVKFVVQLAFAQRDAATDYAIASQLADTALTKHITRSFEIYWAGITS
ncbi:MAG: TetR/AcrR family transcriptional regulator [Chloroflexi bacterium]|nr:MAG: TetR/AcrR family transcriptional regulator [Chloroflexota bacterium]MBL1195221.1 TetR/AcrR family transcriptional regulator [Chloroflexota bacterium]NOH12506.1 TetR/AcrR family transcriptional regulator [Chloroflexota bacterium]